MMKEKGTSQNMLNSYAVFGSGALGGYYGGMLARHGYPVTFVLRSDFEHVQNHGLRVDSINGDFHLKVNAAASLADVRVSTLLICTKATENENLAEQLQTMEDRPNNIVIMQNGLGAEEIVEGIFPEARIYSGLCFLCSNKVGPGHIRHIDYGDILLARYGSGDQACGITDDMKQLAYEFEEAGIDVTLSEDWLAARWMKLAWNIPFNGLSVILGVGTDEIIRNNQTVALVRSLMAEVSKAARASGREIPEDFIEDRIERTKRMKPYPTSMKLDYDHRKAMEVEAIYGEPIRRARKDGVELPETRVLYDILCFLDQKNRRYSAT